MSKFREIERKKIIVSAMRAKNINPNLIIPPAKIEEYYRKHKELFSQQGAGQAADDHDSGARRCGAARRRRSMAEEIRGKLVAGADFDRMAQMYSEDSTRDLGGDWGWIEDKTLAPELCEGRLQSAGPARSAESSRSAAIFTF